VLKCSVVGYNRLGFSRGLAKVISSPVN